MKKKNLLKLIGTTALCAILALGSIMSIGCATSSIHGSASATQNPVMNYENVLDRGLILKNYATTYASEEKVLTYTVEAQVYPLSLDCGVSFTIESYSDGVFDTSENINISDYVEITSSNRVVQIKVKQAFLGGVVTIKAETTGIPTPLSKTMTISYEGIPTSLSVSCNGEKGSEDNPIEIYANQTYTVDVDLDNYFDVIGNGQTLTNYDYENCYVVLNGTAKAKVTSVIDDKTFENNLSVDLKNNFSGCSFDFSDQPDEYSLHNLNVNLDLMYKDIVTSENVTRENENGQLSYSFSVSSATELSFTKTWAELYPNRTDLPSGYVTVEYDFSDLILNCGYNFSFSYSDYLREVCFFKIIPSPTDIVLSPDSIII